MCVAKSAVQHMCYILTADYIQRQEHECMYNWANFKLLETINDDYLA